jgi:hypothetical protein
MNFFGASQIPLKASLRDAVEDAVEDALTVDPSAQTINGPDPWIQNILSLFKISTCLFYASLNFQTM